MSTIQCVQVRLEGVQVRLGEYEDYWGCASTIGGVRVLNFFSSHIVLLV